MSEDLIEFCSKAPERFYAHASVFLRTMSPPDDRPLSGLSAEIWHKFKANQQTCSELTNKIFLWILLRKTIKTSFPDYGLFMAGSSLNGFGLKSSYVDFSFISKNLTLDKNTSLNILTKLLGTLRHEYENISDSKIVPAFIPIIKFRNTAYDINVGINCSNVANIRNTFLLFHYSRGGVQPSVSPSLQKIMKDKFKRDVDIQSLDFFKEFAIPFQTKNHQTLEELLSKFFLYYSSFNYEENVISVHEGEVIPLSVYKLKRTELSDLTFYSRGYVFIEEPFQFGNVGRTLQELKEFQRIKNAFILSYLKLITNGSSNSILST